jgi:cyclohexadienyl dehydratase
VLPPAVLSALAFAAADCAPSRPVPGAPVAEAVPARASLRVGTSGDYAPFSTWAGDRVGDFAGAFAADERLALSWTRFRCPDLVGDLRAGRFDMAADGITVRPERSVAGRFTVPVARGGAVLLVRRPAWAVIGDEGASPGPPGASAPSPRCARWIGPR